MESVEEIQTMLSEALVELEYLRETRSLGHRAIQVVRDKAALAASDARKTVADLENQLQEVERKAEAELSVYDLKLGLTQLDLQKWQHRAAVLQVKLDSAAEDMEHLKKAYKLLADELGSKQDQSDALQRRCQDLQRQLKACEGELETAKQAVVAAESRSQIVGNAAEHAQVAAASQLQKARERADELKTQLEKAQQEKQAAVSRAEAAEAKAVSKNASAQEAKNSERAFQSSLAAMQAEAKSAEERSQQLSAEAEQLRRKLAVGEEQWQARLKKEAALAAQLKQQVKAKDSEIEALRQKARGISEDRNMVDPMGAVSTMLDQLCPSPAKDHSLQLPTIPGNSPAQAQASPSPAASPPPEEVPAGKQEAGKQAAGKKGGKAGGGAKPKAQRGRKRASPEPETEPSVASEAVVERPRRQAKKAQPYWMGNQAEGGASEGAPEEASRSPTAEDDTENGDPSFLPPAANDAYALPAIDETEAAPLPGGLADGGTEEAVPLERQDIDAAASDDTQIEAAAAIPEQPQRKETRASNRAAARGGQKGGTKRSRLAPKEPQAPEPSADAADNTAAVPEAAGREPAPAEAGRPAKDRRSGRPQGISKIDLRTVWGSETPAGDAQPPAAGDAGLQAGAAAAQDPEPAATVAEPERRQPGTKLQGNPLTALNPKVLQAAKGRAQGKPPPAAPLGTRRSQVKPTQRENRGKKTLQPGLYMGRGLAQDLLLGPPGGFKVPRLKKPGA